jgi:hypothetical protein
LASICDTSGSIRLLRRRGHHELCKAACPLQNLTSVLARDAQQQALDTHSLLIDTARPVWLAGGEMWAHQARCVPFHARRPTCASMYTVYAGSWLVVSVCLSVQTCFVRRMGWHQHNPSNHVTSCTPNHRCRQLRHVARSSILHVHSSLRQFICFSVLHGRDITCVAVAVVRTA